MLGASGEVVGDWCGRREPVSVEIDDAAAEKRRRCETSCVVGCGGVFNACGDSTVSATIGNGAGGTSLRPSIGGSSGMNSGGSA